MEKREKNETWQDAPERYSRQTAFDKIGARGQERLFSARVAIVGVGALGTVAANNLCRAGVGFLRLVDRDCVELSNLQRQALFDEGDAAAGLPKAVAARNHLARIDSRVCVEPVVAHVDSSNVEGIVKDVDVVLDGSDNVELRLLVNEACHKLKIPWVYGGVLGSTGNCMTITPGAGACFRCLAPEPPGAGAIPTCASVGVLNMASNVIASIESAEAVKIITGSREVNRGLFALDVWNNAAEYLVFSKNPDCPVCVRGEYALLGRRAETLVASLCGADAYQVIPGRRTRVALDEFAGRLSVSGTVKLGSFTLGFSGGGVCFTLFSDGRAIVKNVGDENAARSVYMEYVGL